MHLVGFIVRNVSHIRYLKKSNSNIIRKQIRTYCKFSFSWLNWNFTRTGVICLFTNILKASYYQNLCWNAVSFMTSFDTTHSLFSCKENRVLLRSETYVCTRITTPLFRGSLTSGIWTSSGQQATTSAPLWRRCVPPKYLQPSNRIYRVKAQRTRVRFKMRCGRRTQQWVAQFRFQESTVDGSKYEKKMFLLGAMRIFFWNRMS